MMMKQIFFLLQVCSPLPRPLPLLQWLFQPQETEGEDAAGSVDATGPQRRLLLVRLLYCRGSVCSVTERSQVQSLLIGIPVGCCRVTKNSSWGPNSNSVE